MLSVTGSHQPPSSAGRVCGCRLIAWRGQGLAPWLLTLDPVRDRCGCLAPPLGRLTAVRAVAVTPRLKVLQSSDLRQIGVRSESAAAVRPQRHHLESAPPWELGPLLWEEQRHERMDRRHHRLGRNPCWWRRHRGRDRRAAPKGHETFISRAASTSSHRLLQRRLLSAHTAQNAA